MPQARNIGAPEAMAPSPGRAWFLAFYCTPRGHTDHTDAQLRACMLRALVETQAANDADAQAPRA